MWWIGVLVVAPTWGTVSTQLFLQSCLSFVAGVTSILGFIVGKVERKTTAVGIVANFGSFIAFSVLQMAGYWFLTDILPFGYSNSEIAIYWIFVVINVLFMLPQIPTKVKKQWQFAMVPGAFEDYLMNQVREEYMKKK